MAKSKSQARREEIMLEENTVVETSVKEGTDSSPVIGVVANCTRLNIRKKAVKTNKPEDVVCVVNAGAKLTIDEAKSNKNWYKVTTEDGKEGFCMKEFVTIK